LFQPVSAESGGESWTPIHGVFTGGAAFYLAVETGSLTLVLDGAEYQLEAGDSIYHDGDCEHGYRNDAGTPCTYYIAMDVGSRQRR
jgi:hypothetical protein